MKREVLFMIDEEISSLHLSARCFFHSVVCFSLPKCSSFMPSTSSQMAFRLHDPQSVGIPP